LLLLDIILNFSKNELTEKFNALLTLLVTVGVVVDPTTKASLTAIMQWNMRNRKNNPHFDGTNLYERGGYGIPLSLLYFIHL